ncbi:T9SS type B sorting domain-containing protein [Croceimicrobium hydrocarbonivorans]|uniref:Gliding motility-associated C-terminal domain-containing protein n=1 Tax=Croceimicrobium hydrocarbonivorans TaxID=2761580 RepID=A0A7H0VE66_9FLAO|nr:gliding motility-associated C-terminal domain-containing protein [Croceimicrobium hydrocarbonivorans]QNR24014.1 gliding motility-associated C-terminal domain-containing protein [Croceimicrobium hydrocarbonivorans]
MNWIKSILFSVLAILFAGNLQASHLLGGEIYWECTPSGQYIFTLTLYRDCTGANIPTTPQSLSGPANIICNYIPALSGDVSPDCPNTALDLQCSSGDDGAIEKGVYRSAPVSLNGIPPAGGWEFAWTSCCRPSLENTNASGYYLRSKMYPYTPPGSSQPLNTSTCYDNSPVFAQDANAVTCPNFLFEFNHLPADKDIDSLVFDWGHPWDAANQNITFGTGYQYTAPFPDGSEDPNNGPNTLDPSSGEITALANNPNEGWYASCVVIKEYRCNQLIGEVYRDVPIYYLDAVDCPTNPSTPSAEIDTSIYQNVQRSGNVYRIRTYPQDTVQFRVVARDLDQFANGSFQQICMKAGGLQLNSNNYASQTGCNGAAPCATLTSFNSTGTYCSVIQNTVEFFWVPDCVHLNFGGCGTASNTYFFTVRMEDDGCAAPKVGLATIIVEVIAGDPTPPGLSCTDVQQDGSIRLGWSQPELDSVLEFNYYRIYGSSSPGGPWTVVDSIPHYDTLSTVVASQGNVSYFYMEMSTGPCDFISLPSQVVSTMTMTMTAIPPNSPEIAQLSWTPLNGTGLNPIRGNIYEVWVEAPEGSGNWQKIGETANTSFTDTVSVCDMLVSYQVRVPDTVVGCYSGSSQDTGRFQDRTNVSNVSLGRVLVNQNNKAMVEFESTQFEDIVEFYLFYNDPQNGWVIVDTIDAGTAMPYEWADSDAGSHSEQFKIVSVDSCGNQSDDLAVSPYNTIYLRNYLNKCEGYSRISWNAYKEFPNGVHEYRVWVQITEPDGTVIPPTILFTASPTDTSFRQNVIRKDYEYCYVIEARDTIANLSSTSNTVCVEAAVPQQSEQLYIAKVTNDPSRNSLDISIYIDGQADVRSFQIQRAPEYYGPYRTIATVGKPTAPPYIISFQDFGVEPSKFNYFYRVTATDSCGGYDTISNISSNMKLEVRAAEDVTNRLRWNAYFGWGGYVDRYEIYRRPADGFNWEKVGENVTINGRQDTTWIDYDIADLVKADPTAGEYCYYVKAVEGGNPQGIVDNQGNPMTAISNQSCAQQEAKVYLATAFRPGSSIGENQTYGPSMRLNEVENYHFYIMNRWGKKVFETNNPEERWDGSYEGNDAPQGVYIYYIKFQTPGGSEQEERGNLSLVR